jgi:hypothetical protein
MRYMYAYKYLFNSPKWATNLLLGAVSGFVPIVGPMVFIGYLFENIEAMRRSGEEKPRDIDMGRLGPYLMRGVWPFLVTLVVSIPFGVVSAILGFISLFVSIAVFAAASPEMAVVGVVVGYLLFFFWAVLFSLLAKMIVIPMGIRAAYKLDFGSAFDMAFLKDFWRRVGRELVLSQVFYALSSFVVILAGMLLCFVGVYPAAALIQFAEYFLIYELLVLYEERGGEPIAFKPYEAKGSDRSPPPDAIRGDSRGEAE